MVTRLRIWIFLLAAFVIFGWPGAAKHVELRPPLPGSATAANDEIAQRLLKIDHGTKKLAPEISTFPADSSLMVVGPNGDGSFAEVHYLLSHLGWPRPVWAFEQTEDVQHSRYSVLPDQPIKPAAMFFYLIEPPVEMQSRAHAIGPNLKIVPLEISP